MSEIVPEGWGTLQLGSVGHFFGGLTGKSAKDFGNGKPFLTYMQVFSQKLSDRNSVNFVQVGENENQHRVRFGDILFTTSSETPHEIGMTAVFLDEDWSPFLNSFCFGLRPKSLSTIDPQFAKYLFRGGKFRTDIRPLAQGSTRFNLSKENLKKLHLLIPSLPEQKKIASILTSVDEVIENTQKQIDKLQDLKKATMNELLTKGIGHTQFKDSELGRIPQSWEVRRVSDFLVQSKTKGKDNLPIYSVLIEGGMVNRETQDRRIPSELDDTSNLYVKKGNLAYNMMRMWQGASGIAPEDCLVSPAYVVCEPTEIIVSNFLGFLMKNKDSVQKLFAFSQGITSDRLRLYFEHFAQIRFALPSIQEQHEISKAIGAVEAKLFKTKIKVKQTQSLKKSLMQDLLTGKVRVKI